METCTCCISASDDEAYAAGGTIRLLTDQGVPVTYACGTLGQMGRNMGRTYSLTVKRFHISVRKN